MRKGDKVICINDTYVIDFETPNEYKNICLPVRGKEYTIREIVMTETGENALRFEEIKNKKIYHDIAGYKEPAFALHRFKKT